MSEYTIDALLAAHERAVQAGPRPMTSITPTQRAFFRAGARAVIQVQRKWGDLTLGEAVEELRLGSESVFFPFFEDDPHVEATCDECGRVHVGAEGTCSECGREVPL